MTTSAPQWPSQEGVQEREPDPSSSPVGPMLRVVSRGAPREPQPVPGPQSPPDRPAAPAQVARAEQVEVPDRLVAPERSAAAERLVGPERLVPSEWLVPSEGPELRQRRRASMRRGRFVVVRNPAERDLWEKRRLARPGLPSPAAVTRDIALGLLEVEAGCRSAVQLERIFSQELWESLEQRIGRRGGPLPSGRSLISVHCQEDRPGLADTVAVVHKGDRVRPVALRLDASGGRWRVTELRWWRNETDTTATPGRDGGSR
jgi:hypothetical protein